MSDQAEWEKWEGWLPGDDAPGDVPGARKPAIWRRWTQRQTVPPPPGASLRHAPPSSTTSPPPPLGRSGPRRRGPRADGAPSGRPGSSGARWMVMAVVLLVGAAGFVLPVLIGSGEGDESDSNPGVSASMMPGAVLPEADPGPAPARDLLLTGAAAEMVELRAAVGDGLGKARQLVIYPDRLVAEVEPPTAPGTVERWVVLPGEGPTGPDPLDVPSEQVVAQLFSLSDVDLGRLPAFVASAQVELTAADGLGPLVASHLVVQRDPLGELRVWVHAGSDTWRGVVVLTAGGEVVDVQTGPR